MIRVTLCPHVRICSEEFENHLSCSANANVGLQPFNGKLKCVSDRIYVSKVLVRNRVVESVLLNKIRFIV